MELTLRSGPSDVIAIEEGTQVGQVRRRAQQLANEIGFDDADSGRVALVATELATNVLKHGRGGSMTVRDVPGRRARGVELVAVDSGPGFHLSACLADGYSTGGTQGIGLGAVKRQAQVMDAYSDAHGSVVMARVFPRNDSGGDMPFGISRTALRGEFACGDAWALAIRDSVWSALVVDGLGHGEMAAIAADAAVAGFLARPHKEPSALMAHLHQSMAGTRGGAVALAHIDTERGTLRFAGVGNIAGSLVSLEGSRGLASHPGIVGVQFRRAQAFDFGDIIGQLLILHSDGVQSRWRLADYPGLILRHPAVIAAVLHRDFNRHRDDATVMVIAMERANA